MKRPLKRPAKVLKPKKQFKMLVEHSVVVKASSLNEARSMLRNKLVSPVKSSLDIMVSRKAKVTAKPSVRATQPLPEISST